MDEDGADAEDEKAPLTLEQWRIKLEEERAEYARVREIIRLRVEIANRMDELAALLPKETAEKLIKRHHPNEEEIRTDYGSHYLTFFMTHGKKYTPAEYKWFEEADRVLSSEELANILYPNKLGKDRSGTLLLVRKLRNRVKMAKEEDLREEFESNEQIMKRAAIVCKAHNGICEGCPRNVPDDDVFQCNLSFLIARDPDRFSDC